jgi:cell division protein FtsQ
MSQLLVNAPQARSWRDIPQPVKPRVMSRGGQWRLAASLARVLGFVAVVAVVAWGAWEVVAALQENPSKMPAAARTVPVKNFVLKTNAEGVLGAAWLRTALALPKGATLMELDLQQLRTRLLADGQVSVASLTRNFPDTLEVRIAERSPIARLQAQFGDGTERTLLVARDGVVFPGVGYDAAQISLLPWLAGMKLTRAAGRFAPIEGMSVVADLLAHAQLDTPQLYASWQVVSLARLASDREIEVQTKPGTTVVFGTDGDFAVQLAKLDYQLELLASATLPVARINLALGREVPVSFVAPPAATGGAKASTAQPAKAVSAPFISLFPNSQSQTKREL